MSPLCYLVGLGYQKTGLFHLSFIKKIISSQPAITWNLKARTMKFLIGMFGCVLLQGKSTLVNALSDSDLYSDDRYLNPQISLTV